VHARYGVRLLPTEVGSHYNNRSITGLLSRPVALPRAEIRVRFVVVLAITVYPDAPDDSPCFELAEGRADAGFADGQFASYLIQAQGLGAQVEQSK